MNAKLLDGRSVSTQIKEKLKAEIDKSKLKPKLAVILIGDNKVSEIYVRMKEKAAVKIGCGFEFIKKPAKTTQEQVERLIDKLNKEKSVTGVIVQKPLPKHINSDEIGLLLSPEKDVDGLN